jgi:hypothetical protein
MGVIIDINGLQPQPSAVTKDKMSNPNRGHTRSKLPPLTKKNHAEASSANLARADLFEYDKSRFHSNRDQSFIHISRQSL